MEIKDYLYTSFYYKTMSYWRTLLLLFCLSGVLFSCGGGKIKEGKITYSVDYPNHKDNFFLYSILPKEMELSFKDGKMKSLIKKVDLQNALLVDCNQKQVAAYFQYGEEAFNVKLNATDIEKMLDEQKEYTIVFKDEEKQLLGFKAKKAVATCKTDKKDQIELWYTEDLDIPQSNWYNPFKDVPGVLLEYAIDRYGVRMEFKAKKFDQVSINDEELELPKTGDYKTYIDYNNKLNGLFKPFE